MTGHRRLTVLVGIACTAALSLPATPARAAVIHQGSGFKAWDVGLLSSYTIYLVDSTHIEDFRAEAESVAAEITTITGITVNVASGYASHSPGQGEITIVVSTSSGCEGVWYGCTNTPVFAYSGGPRTDVEYIQSAQVTLNLVLVALPADAQQHVVAHEIGHAFGLQHYEFVFEGHHQIMRPDTSEIGGDEVHYQSGDINGLLYVRNRGLL